MLLLEILLAILGISVLVIIHEAGHYFAARAFGMRVIRFSIGLGPALWRYQPKDSPTIFQVCAIPFLAYVQIAGMNPAEEVDPKDPGLFPNKSLFGRMVTIFAGSAANYVTASILAFGIAVFGWPEDVPTEPMVIGAVSADSPAAKAGLQPGDVIVQAEGRPIRNVKELIAVTSPRAGQATRYVVERNGRALPPIVVTPRADGNRGVIGVAAKLERRYVPMPVSEAALAAVVFPVKLTALQLTSLAEKFHKPSLDGMAGPVGMGKMVVEQVRQGPTEYIFILMLLSVALGMFNLLPFPALDGGRLVFLFFELITRKRPNERVEATIHMVGLLLLLGVLVLVTFRDVTG